VTKLISMPKRKCPKCGSSNTVKILYGYPTEEAFLLAEEGKIKLGGCCVFSENPEYYCKDCEQEWRDTES